MNIHWLYLGFAIFAEVIATSSLKISDGFSRLAPSLIVILGYGCSFYFLSLTLRAIPLGITYAVWSGVGLVLISLVGWVWQKQQLDWPAVLGMAFIGIGVLIINLHSQSIAH